MFQYFAYTFGLFIVFVVDQAGKGAFKFFYAVVLDSRFGVIAVVAFGRSIIVILVVVRRIVDVFVVIILIIVVISAYKAFSVFDYEPCSRIA